MQDTTPQLITPDQFNQSVKGWSVSVRSKMLSNVPKSTGKQSDARTEPKLSKSLVAKIKLDKDTNTVNRVIYTFARHGVFVHYGVGRGYARQGNSIVKTAKTKDKSFKRKPVDWFDVEVRTSMPRLAEIVQEYYGDWAMDQLLSKMDKSLITKK